MLMKRHYLDLGSASDWSCRVGNLIQPIRSTTHIWVVTRHQYGILAYEQALLFGRVERVPRERASERRSCTRFSDVIWRGNQWWRREMSS